ncbi:hypothetical protein OROHE_002142 [Orobanche hederae]
MEGENRKRESKGKRLNPPKNDDDRRKRVAPPQPGDEEVNEFFSSLEKARRAAASLKLNGVTYNDGDVTATSSWKPTFQVEDFHGVEKDPVRKS